MATRAPSPAPTAERRVYAPLIEREAALRPASWNAGERTVDVVWTTGSRGVKLDWNAGMVEEELATTPASVRLERLNAGAPVLNTHQQYDLSGQIGVVVPGSARMVRGQGIATLQLSERADLAPIIDDIAAGVIRNLSVGYRVHTYEIEQRQGQLPLFRAVDWEPFELSFVPVPFDAAAQVRSGHNPQPCTLRTVNLETRDMPRQRRIAADSLTPASDPPAPDPNGGDQPATITQLRSLTSMAAESYGVPAGQCAELALELAERGLSEPDARAEIMQIMTERQRNATGHISAIGRAIAGASPGGDTFDNPNFHARAIEDALYSRMSGQAPSEPAREFRGMTMVQLAGEMLVRAGARDVQRMAPNEVLNAAAWNTAGARSAMALGLNLRERPHHTTSDFPDLLTASGNRYLIDQFAAAATVMLALGRERSANDFREISGLQLSAFGKLPEVNEDGQLTAGTFESRKETYRLKTFGKTFGLSRQAIINDDLDAFGRSMTLMARAAAETQASLLADLINSNPAMADGKALFHADHDNLADAGAAPDVTTLAAGRLSMRSQKDLDGVTPLAAAPKFILVSPKRETACEQLLVSTTVPTNTADANPFQGKLTLLVEPRINADPWYLFGDPQLVPVLEYAYLNGQPGPRVDMREGWTVLGQEFRVYMDFGAGLVDHRGAFKNAGA